MSSYFCEFIWILFLLFEYFNIINKYKIFVNLEKTFLIKKESMIAIIRVNNGVNLGLPLSVLLADSMTLTTFYAEEMFSNEINKYKKELKKHILNIYHKNLDKYTSKIYTNCSLIFETENYCLYSGEITDKKNKRRIEKFKVYKVYSNASNFLDGGVNNV